MPLTRAELIVHLVEQLQFLDASCASFDLGAEIEAKRLATSLRVLLHDTAASHSVLEQLGEKHAMRWPSNLIEPEAPPVPGAVSVESSYPGLAIMGTPFDGGNPVWVPYYETEDVDMASSLSFDGWWKASVMHDGTGHGFSRRNFVLVVANKDGGSHVDGSGLPADFAALASGSIGWSSGMSDDSMKPFTDSPAPAALRQVAEEVRVAIRHHFGAELGAAETARFSPRPDRGEMMYVGGMQMWRHPS